MTIIYVGDRWVDKVSGEVLKFFKDRFLDSKKGSPCPGGVSLLSFSRV